MSVPARCVAAVVVLALASSVHADSASAEALFREGRELLKEGKLDLACPKLAESHRLAPSSGTLINLALCHEQQGRIATAWGEYLEAARLAKVQDKPARAAEAEARAAALAPKVPYVRITARSTPDLAASQLVITRDGEILSSAVLGSRLPIDPGTHQIGARAEGFLAWSQTLEVKPGDNLDVEIPALEKAPAPKPEVEKPAPVVAPPKPAAPPPVDEGDRGSGSWLLPAAVSTGVVGLAVGAWFGVRALGSYRDAERECPDHKGCTADTLDTYRRANAEAWVSNIGFGVGVLGAAASVYLVLTRPSKSTVTTASPVTGPGLLGLSVTTTF